ncbi:MAG: radical SAM protein [Armatimonadia bacterium]
MDRAGLGQCVSDRRGRRVDSLHLSVWGACNVRCLCCRPTPTASTLSLEDIQAIVTATAHLGFTRVRLTGGDPLLRPDIIDLVHVVATVPGILEVALTTNGTLLADQARPLALAGLQRLNVRLHSRNPRTYRLLTGSDCLPAVWEGLAAAEAAGLGPIRLNVVIRRGINDGEIGELADLTTRNLWQVRFLEYPPVGPDYQALHVPLAEVAQELWRLGELHPVTSPGITDLYHIPLALGTVGLLGWQHAPGCTRCHRLHVTVDGRAHGCAIDPTGVDLRPALHHPQRLQALLRQAIAAKPAHCPVLPLTEPSRRRLGG